MHSTKAPSTRIRFCSKTRKFFLRFVLRPHLSGENGHRIRIFSETFSRVEIPENAAFSSTCGRTKTTGVFEYDDVKNYFVFHRLTFWCGPAKTIRMLYVWTRIISKTDFLRFQKYPDTCGWGSKYVGNLSLK